MYGNSLLVFTDILNILVPGIRKHGPNSVPEIKETGLFGWKLEFGN
jgi:hypothetical protein